MYLPVENQDEQNQNGEQNGSGTSSQTVEANSVLKSMVLTDVDSRKSEIYFIVVLTVLSRHRSRSVARLIPWNSKRRNSWTNKNATLVQSKKKPATKAADKHNEEKQFKKKAREITRVTITAESRNGRLYSRRRSAW